MKLGDKPHKGRITNVSRWKTDGGYLYRCQFMDHPKFAETTYKIGRYGHTSLVVNEVGDEIETLNTRYTIIR
jgi:hypothetical protein